MYTRTIKIINPTNKINRFLLCIICIQFLIYTMYISTLSIFECTYIYIHKFVLINRHMMCPIQYYFCSDWPIIFQHLHILYISSADFRKGTAGLK